MILTLGHHEEFINNMESQEKKISEVDSEADSPDLYIFHWEIHFISNFGLAKSILAQKLL